MISLGMGEFLLIVIVMLLSFDVKHLAKLLRTFNRFKGSLFKIQTQWRTQLEQIAESEEVKESIDPILGSKPDLRKWGKERVRLLTSYDRSRAAQNMMNHLSKFEDYEKCQVVAAYSSLSDEIDSSFLCRKILKDEKVLLLPYLDEKGEMKFCQITDFDTQLSQGAHGIMEPLEELRLSAPVPTLYFIPGRCFDSWGGRIGRGKGHYDKFLEGKTGIKIGLAYDGQLAPKKLKLGPTDIYMDFLLTDKRFAKVEKT